MKQIAFMILKPLILTWLSTRALILPEAKRQEFVQRFPKDQREIVSLAIAAYNRELADNAAARIGEIIKIS